MAHVLVIGASRGIGLETVRQALDSGQQVRAFARMAHRIPLDHAALEKVQGDALDREAVAKALAGVEAVIQVLGASGLQSLIVGTTLFSAATRILVDAMGGASVRRLITVTGLGAGDSRGVGSLLYTGLMFPLLLKRIYDDKDVQEQIIRRSNLDWTIVRPGLLTNAQRSGQYQVLVEPKEWRSGSISRADVADFLVRQIGDLRLVGKTPLLVA
jgi:putative NADH-flavin reductase